MPKFKITVKTECFLDAVIDATSEEALQKMWDDTHVRNFDLEMSYIDYNLAEIVEIETLEDNHK